MRILLVTHRYPPFGLSGVERVSEQTARALVADGHEVTVLTRRESAAPPLPTAQRSVQDGVDVLTIAGGGPIHGRFPREEPRLELLFERTLLELAPDVVLISHLIGHSPLYVSIAHRWHVPVVLELHDFYVACERAHLERPTGALCAGPEGGRACAQHCFAQDDHALPRWALRSHLFRHALEQTDEALCPSQFVADYFERQFQLGTRPTVIGNGVDVGTTAVRAPRQPGQPLRLACVGMVVAHKGPHVVVDALRLAQLAAVRLTLFGGLVQPYFGELLDAADDVADLELRAFGGFTPKDLPFLLADIDAVVIPSLVWETYSIVAREALSLGIPVIASRIGALPEAIRDGENGMLFTPGSARELAAILLGLAQDPSQLQRLRSGIRADDWIPARRRARDLAAVLDGVVRRGPRPVDPHALAELADVRALLIPESTAA